MKKMILPTCGLVLTLSLLLSGVSINAEDPMPSASSVGTECSGGGGPGGIGGSSQPADCITINCDGVRNDVPTGNTSAGTPIQPGTAEATNTVICVGEDPDIHEVTSGKDTDKIEVDVFCDGVLDQTVNKKVSDGVTFVVDPTNDYSTAGVVQAKFKWVDGGSPYNDGDKSGMIPITVVQVSSIGALPSSVCPGDMHTLQVETTPAGHYGLVSVEAFGCNAVYNAANGQVDITFQEGSEDAVDFKGVTAKCGGSDPGKTAETIVVTVDEIVEDTGIITTSSTGPIAATSGGSIPGTPFRSICLGDGIDLKATRKPTGFPLNCETWERTYKPFSPPNSSPGPPVAGSQSIATSDPVGIYTFSCKNGTQNPPAKLQILVVDGPGHTSTRKPPSGGPTGGAATQATINGVSPGAIPAPTFYDVTGANIAQANNNMFTVGPVDSDGTHLGGQTTTAFSDNENAAVIKQKELSCDCPDGTSVWSVVVELQDLVVNVDIAILLPNWLEYATGSCLGKQEWDRFFAALKGHEEMHAAIAIQFRDQLVEKLEGLQALGTGCGLTDAVNIATAAVNAEAAAIVAQVLAAHDTAQTNYDALPPTGTNHGATEGATIDISQQGNCP